MTQQDVEQLTKLLKDNSDCVLFIKDFILRFRFADLASHTKTTASYIKGTAKIDTTEKIIDAYSKDAERIIEDYENNCDDE